MSVIADKITAVASGVSRGSIASKGKRQLAIAGGYELDVQLQEL